MQRALEGLYGLFGHAAGGEMLHYSFGSCFPGLSGGFAVD